MPASLAQDLDEKVRAPVDHLGVVREVGRGIHHPEKLHDGLDAAEVAEGMLRDSKQLQAGEAGFGIALLDGGVAAQLAPAIAAVRLLRSLAQM